MGVIKRLGLLLSGVFGLLLVAALPIAGASSANISHSYHADSSIPNGSLVSLDAKRSDFVQPANTDNGSRLLGVAVSATDSLLAVGAQSGLVQVATNGTASALVSTLNGDIHVGDQVSVSPFNGVGMKADPGSHVIGLAQSAFNAHSSGNDQQVTDNGGKTKRLHVGYIRLAIAVTVNSAGVSQGNGLQRLAKSLTGHSVSTLRVILSLLVAIATLVTLITLIYGSIYGTIVSVGRNPLARHAIYRSLWAVMAMVLLTAGIATLIILLLLR